MVTNSSSSMQQPLCHDSESSALLQFKQSFLTDEHASYDPSAYSKVSMWKSHGEGSNCCSWDGLSVTGRLVMLSAFSLPVVISMIPCGVGQLSRLRSLNLSYSGFSGPIPSSLVELVNLRYLSLRGNYLNGTVDLNMLKKLKNLTYLQLSNMLSLLGYNDTNVTLPKLSMLRIGCMQPNQDS
ncbi:hypothetical protein CK203_073963 [Vitis vinifera]|uniref:Leucine-rich repeat-containing N-terminal plant-type domain-containing protein n=1 Tax=Vitis vinifera TaxID=29760 RepID=A0A438DPX8_VITVI|nr:hypothetical protein CK203_073963 [Vitis vinifera]